MESRLVEVSPGGGCDKLLWLEDLATLRTGSQLSSGQGDYSKVSTPTYGYRPESRGVTLWRVGRGGA